MIAHDSHPLFLDHTADYINRGERDWDQRCLGMEAMVSLNLLAYTAQPLPKIARVDLAAVFFSRDKLRGEDVAFGECRPLHTSKAE